MTHGEKIRAPKNPWCRGLPINCLASMLDLFIFFQPL
jgi:hypothetical protein